MLRGNENNVVARMRRGMAIRTIVITTLDRILPFGHVPTFLLTRVPTFGYLLYYGFL